MSAVEIVAKELANHLCSEDESPVSPTVRRQYADSVADVVLAALKAGGYAVAQLPESSTDEMGALTWPVTQHWQGRRTNDGEVRIRKSDGRISATSVSNPHDCPEDAHSLGLALLAAAAAYEEQS